MQWGLCDAFVVALGRRFSRFLVFIFFLRKIAISLGAWPFIERTHTFRGQQAEGSQLSTLTVVQTVSFQQDSCGEARATSASISGKENRGKEPRF